MLKSSFLLFCALSIASTSVWAADATANVIVIAVKRMPEGHINVVIDTNPPSGNRTLLQCVMNQPTCVMPLAGDTAKILFIDKDGTMGLLFPSGRAGTYVVAESYQE